MSGQSTEFRERVLTLVHLAVRNRIALFIHVCLVVHVAYLGWFAYAKALPCLFTDMVSVAIYSYLALVRRRFEETDMVVTYFEILAFASIMILMLGQGTCFEFFIFGMNSIMFMFAPSYGLLRYPFMAAGFMLIPITRMACTWPALAAFEDLRQGFAPYMEATWWGNYILASLVVIVSYALFSRDSTELYNRLNKLSNTDQLTGLHNRRYLEHSLNLDNRGYALAMADIDDFKRVNDTYGHAMGDVVLRDVARLFAQVVGRVSGGEVVRWGGEEFVVFLPACTAGDAHAILEDMRSAVEAARFEQDDRIRVTVTFGLSTSSGLSLSQVIERADAALYEGKRTGKNRVVVAS